MIAVVLDGMNLTGAQWAVLEPTFRPRRRPNARGRPWTDPGLHRRGKTVKRVSRSGAILAARCAEGSESTSALTLYYVYSNTTLTVLLRTEYGTP
jgi:hypothetical protein